MFKVNWSVTYVLRFSPKTYLYRISVSRVLANMFQMLQLGPRPTLVRFLLSTNFKRTPQDGMLMGRTGAGVGRIHVFRYILCLLDGV
jgi:hypothetical protein